MNQSKQDKIEPQLEAVERALSNFPDKNFAPPEQRGIHELVTEVRRIIDGAVNKLEIIEQRLADFDRLQSSFYNGRKP